MTGLSREQAVRREKTLLTALLLSTPGPLVLGIAVLSTHSVTQLADFIRRSVELAALYIAWWIFRQLQRNTALGEADLARLERMARLSVAAAMGSSGAVMLLVALSRLTLAAPGGKATLGLMIATLGLLTNGWFWRRYATLTREQFSAVTAAQQTLYRAKTLVDLCVVIALAAVTLAPAHPATRYIDLLGSVAVAGYLLWSGVRTAGG